MAEAIANYLSRKDHDGKPYEPVVVVRRYGFRAMLLELTKIESGKDVVIVDRLPKAGEK